MLELSWAILGAVLELFRAVLEPFGGSSGTTIMIVVAGKPFLGPSWPVLGPFWGPGKAGNPVAPYLLLFRTWAALRELGCSSGPALLFRTWAALQDLGCSSGPGLLFRTWALKKGRIQHIQHFRIC